MEKWLEEARCGVNASLNFETCVLNDFLCESRISTNQNYDANSCLMSYKNCILSVPRVFQDCLRDVNKMPQGGLFTQCVEAVDMLKQSGLWMTSDLGCKPVCEKLVLKALEPQFLGDIGPVAAILLKISLNEACARSCSLEASRHGSDVLGTEKYTSELCHIFGDECMETSSDPAKCPTVGSKKNEDGAECRAPWNCSSGFCAAGPHDYTVFSQSTPTLTPVESIDGGDCIPHPDGSCNLVLPHDFPRNFAVRDGCLLKNIDIVAGRVSPSKCVCERGDQMPNGAPCSHAEDCASKFCAASEPSAKLAQCGPYDDHCNCRRPPSLGDDLTTDFRDDKAQGALDDPKRKCTHPSNPLCSALNLVHGKPPTSNCCPDDEGTRSGCCDNTMLRPSSKRANGVGCAEFSECESRFCAVEEAGNIHPCNKSTNGMGCECRVKPQA